MYIDVHSPCTSDLFKEIKPSPKTKQEKERMKMVTTVFI